MVPMDSKWCRIPSIHSMCEKARCCRMRRTSSLSATRLVFVGETSRLSRRRAVFQAFKMDHEGCGCLKGDQKEKNTTLLALLFQDKHFDEHFASVGTFQAVQRSFNERHERVNTSSGRLRTRRASTTSTRSWQKQME